uniref:DUF2281 domain-containing protein n=1 Tax=Flavobacterium sp. TaxID=239 RepID=UPI00404A3C51
MESLSLKKIELLPNHLKKEVHDFIEFLLQKEEKRKKEKKNNPKKFSGILTDEEAESYKKSIAECKKIDLNEW